MLDHITKKTAALSRSEISQMTDEQLSRLNYDALVDVVLASNVPVRDVQRIHSFEGDTVFRLARMARRHCQEVTDS